MCIVVKPRQTPGYVVVFSSEGSSTTRVHWKRVEFTLLFAYELCVHRGETLTHKHRNNNDAISKYYILNTRRE